MQMRLVTRSGGRLLARAIARALGGALLVSLAACVVHDTPPVNPGYGYDYGYGPPGGRQQPYVNPSVGEPEPNYVSSMPPEPLYEQMTPAPGQDSVWIDGYWHWNSYE